MAFFVAIIYLSLRKASDKLIKLWDAYTGQIIRTLEGHTEGISDVAWSNDSEYLASASDDKTVRIWKPDTVNFLLALFHCCFFTS
jgi:COMPASS component SWD3